MKKKCDCKSKIKPPIESDNQANTKCESYTKNRSFINTTTVGTMPVRENLVHGIVQQMTKNEQPQSKNSHLGSAMKGRGGHQANDGGAVGVGDKRPFPHADLNSLHCLWIDLRYHQRDLLVHPKRGAIVHHDGPLLHRDRPELLTD